MKEKGDIFKLKGTAIFKAVLLGRNPIFGKAVLLGRISIVLFILSLGATMARVDIGLSAEALLGLSFLFLGFYLLFWQIGTFFEIKVKHPKISIGISDAIKMDGFNSAEFLSYKVAEALSRSGSDRSVNRFLYHLLGDPDFNFIFSRMGIALSDLRRELRESRDGEPGLTDEIISGAVAEVAGRNGKRVKKNDILFSASERHDHLKGLFADRGIDSRDIRNLANWIYKTRKAESDRRKFWKWKNLVKKGSLAKDWASGYTILLDRYSIDWTKNFKKTGFPEIIGHKDEISAMERILSRERSNNVLLVGESGVGRKSLVHELARRSFYGESLSEVNHKRVVEFDLPFLLASVDDRDEMEKILERIFSEVVESGNTILVIPEIHNFIGTTSSPGRIDISGILTSYLSLPQFRIIGITDYAGYRRSVDNSSVAPFFEKIEVSEMSDEDVIRHLQNLSLMLEYKHGKIVSYPAIKEIVNYCSKYIPSKPFPEKAVELLDEAITYLVQAKKNILLPEHVAKLISRKTNIPVGAMEEREKEILLNLEDLIHEKVVNQEEAVREVSSALRRSRSEISSGTKPMGTFLFLGPTGVGKTETAKALTEVYFGSSKKMIRIDMSEFQNLSDIARLIGSVEYDGVLTTKMREEPFSLLLLDELEKAHPDILNLFLQVLDEGHITDGMGRKVDFKSSIVIATSNAGSAMILDNIKRKLDWSSLKEDLLNHLFSTSVFRPEFINRFDSVVLFSPLSRENLLDISQLLLERVARSLKEKNMELVITEELKEKIVDIGYNPTFGAREIKRVIQDKVENALASALISGRLEKGSRLKIDPETFEIDLL